MITANPRVIRFWLHFTRAIWITLAAVAIFVYIIATPLYYQSLKTICTSQDFVKLCNYDQIDTTGLRLLEANGITIDFHALILTITSIFSTTIVAVIALVIFWRKSSDRMAWQVSLMFIQYVMMMTWSESSFPQNLLWLGRISNHLQSLNIILFFFLFPSGLPAPRWSIWLLMIYAFLSVSGLIFPDFDNYLATSTVGAIAWISIFISGIGSQIYRYIRVSNSHQREQTKWILYTLVVFVILLLSPQFFPSLETRGTWGFIIFRILNNSFFPLMLAITVSIAILRNRLFDIDLVIRRTLLYGMLSLVLGLVYLGLVIVFGQVIRGFTGQESPLAVVLSTLIIAALFNPLRHGLQTAIDRRFYRQKYDIAKSLERFSVVVRNEVELGALSESLVNLVATALQPQSFSLWLKPPHQGKQVSQTGVGDRQSFERVMQESPNKIA